MRSLLFRLVTLALTFIAAPVLAQQYQYDSAGRMTAALYPGGGSIHYEYDANSNITRIKYSSGAVTGLPPDGVIDTPMGNVTIKAGKTVSFSGTGTDPDGATPLTYYWDFGGGAMNSTLEDPGAVKFAKAGTFTVKFTVTDATSLDDPTPATVLVTVKSSGGGGSMSLFLPLLCAVLWLVRRRRAAMAMAMLLAAGAAQAQTWSQMNSPTDQTLNDVWAASSSDAWAVGDAGTVLHYDGTSWVQVDLGITTRLRSVWGISPSDIMIVGESGLVLQYNGSTWSTVDIGDSTAILNDVWYDGSGPRYIVGARGAWFNRGSGWERQYFDSPFVAGPTTQTPTLVATSVRASSSHVVVATYASGSGDEGLYVATGTGHLKLADTYNGNALWMFDDTHMFYTSAPARGGTARRLNGGDPTAFQNWATETGGGGGGNDVWATSIDNMYVVGENSTYGIIQHYDGSGWQQQVAVNYRKFYGVHGPDASTAFAVGQLGAIYRLSGPKQKKTAANYPFSGVTEGNVNTYTGELVYETTDFSIGSEPFEFRRYYASKLWAQGTVGGSLGENWTHNFEWRLDTNYGPAGNQVRVTDYRGTEYVFNVGATSTTLESPKWANMSLTNVNGTYVLSDLDAGRMYGLGPQGLAWTEDRNGNRLTPIYYQGVMVSVTNDKETIIRFEYTANGRLARVFVPEGNLDLEVAFTYDAGLLTAATASGNVQTGYAYTGGALLTSVEVAGAVEKEWDYGAQDRVIATTYTEGGPFIYTYNGNDFSITEPGATIRSYSHNDDGALLSTTNGVGATRTWGYDSLGRQISRTDPLMRTTSWSYDPVHRMIASITEPGGFVTQFDYGLGSSRRGLPFYDLYGVENPDGGIDQYGYDNLGNVVSYVDAGGGEWDFAYDSNGRLTLKQNPEGGQTRYTYTLDGRVLTSTDPSNNVTEYGYDLYLRLNKIYYPDATEATLEYSTRFVPDRVTLKSGAIFTYTYDSGNRLARIDRSDGYFEQYAYDTAGSIISRTLPGNRTTSYRYDARRNIDQVLAPDMTFESFLFDAADRLVRYTDADMRAWNFEYAADDAPTAVVKPGGERVDYNYAADPRGLLGTIMQGTEMSSFTYDASGRLSAATDPLQRTNTVTRNAAGDISQIVTTPANSIRAFEHDRLGNVTRFTTPGGGDYLRSFGADGLLDTVTDALGNVTSYARDALNGIDSIQYPDGESVVLNHGANGLVSSASASDGTVINITSTPEGQITGGTGASLAVDATGITNSNGIVIMRDSRGLVSGMELETNKDIGYEYNGRGQAVRVLDWWGMELDLTYTSNGQLASIAYPNGTTTTYTYDPAGEVTGIGFGLLGSISLTRNGGRVESAVRDLPGPAKLPDEDRRRAYDAASRPVTATLDLRGNVLDDGQRTWHWDGLNRLDATDGESIEYDALGGVIGISGSVNSTFTLNYALESPRASIEKDGSGNVRWFYVHTPDGRLLYRVSPAGDHQYYHFDELGNTVFMTDDAGTVIQTYAIAPHGEVFDFSGHVQNYAIISAESGAMTIGDNATVMTGSGSVDSRSGYRLSPQWSVSAAVKGATLDFEGGFSRSVSPGLAIDKAVGSLLQAPVVPPGAPALEASRGARSGLKSNFWLEAAEKQFGIPLETLDRVVEAVSGQDTSAVSGELSSRRSVHVKRPALRRSPATSSSVKRLAKRSSASNQHSATGQQSAQGSGSSTVDSILKEVVSAPVIN
jgi:YD repeat-containing protein